MIEKNINIERFNKFLPKKFREEVCFNIKNILEKNKNEIYVSNIDYFVNMGDYAGIYKDKIPKDFCRMSDLYSPNVAALDFFIENINKYKDKIILDYGCGMGIFSIYLKKIGYNKVYNYDNWSQIKKRLLLIFY